MAKRYFFTYGDSPKYAYIGGWSEIIAPNKLTASLIHDKLHGDETYEAIYTEEHFQRYLARGERLGYGCHEQIVYQRLLHHDFYMPEERDKRGRRHHDTL